jgi:hypothetical protein
VSFVVNVLTISLKCNLLGVFLWVLSGLKLAESVIGFEGAISISKLTNLRKLELCNNYLYGIGVYKIGGLPKCKSLNLEPRGK